MAATKLYYNDVVIYNCLTRSFAQEVVYDDSNTDSLGTRFVLEVEGLVHAQVNPLSNAPAYTTANQSSLTASTATATMEEVRRKLLQPRATLLFYAGSHVLLRCVPSTPSAKGDADMDVANGPKPKHCNIVAIAGDKLYRISFAIECHRLDCGTGYGGEKTNGNVLSNRWSISEEMDGNWFTTRRITGTIRLSSSNLALAHSYRGYVVPSLEVGFKRESIDYTSTPDGLAANYVVVDKQVHTAAPVPATTMNGSHTESTDDGITWMSSCNVTLEGAPHSDKRDLIRTAVHIMDSRVGFLQQEQGKDFMIESASITDHFGEANRVEASIRVRSMRPATSTYSAGRLLKDHLGTPLKLDGLKNKSYSAWPADYKPYRSGEPKLYGYQPHGSKRDLAPLKVLHCYLQTPCSPNHSIGKFSQKDNTESDSTNSPTESPGVTGSQSETLPSPSSDKYDSKHLSQGIYTYAKLENTYQTSYGRIQAPYALSGLAVAKASSAGTTTTGAPAASASGGKGSSYDATKQFTDTCAIYAVHRPVSKRIVKIEFERVAEVPSLPEPVDTFEMTGASGGSGTGVKATLMGVSITPYPWRLSSDGVKKVYRVDAEYVYALSRPLNAKEAYQIGRLPIFKTDNNETEVSGNKLFKDKLK